MFFCQLSPKTFGIYSEFGEKTEMLCIFVRRIFWETQNNQNLDVTWKRLVRNDLKCWQFKCSVSHNYYSPLELLNWLITGSWHKFKSGVGTHACLLIITAIFWLDKQRNHIFSCRDRANGVRSSSCMQTLVCQKHKCWGRSSCSSAPVVWPSLSAETLNWFVLHLSGYPDCFLFSPMRFSPLRN